MVFFRGYFRFPALSARGAYSDVSPSTSLSPSFSFPSPSRPLEPPSPSFYLLPPRSVLFRRLFNIQLRLLLAHPIRRNLLIASFLDGGCAASFLAEEISGLDHAIDFHASPVLVFLSLSPAAARRRLSCLPGSTGDLNSIFRVSIGNTFNGASGASPNSASDNKRPRETGRTSSIAQEKINEERVTCLIRNLTGSCLRTRTRRGSLRRESGRHATGPIMRANKVRVRGVRRRG